MGIPVIAHSYHIPKKFQTPLLNSLDNVVLHFNLLWISELRNSISIFRRHAILKTLILCFDTAFIYTMFQSCR